MLQLRPFQQEALQALSNPGHVLCVAATGSGKSLIYERAALKPERRTLLITPLVALARQQHEQLAQKSGIAVALGAGTFSKGPPTGGAGIWIISPETLLNFSRIQALRQWRPDFVVVDECHCLWEWGEGFRPAFQKIPEIIKSENIQSSLWLTATLPVEAREELRTKLPTTLRELGHFDLPPSLDLSVARVPWADRPSVLLGWLANQSEPGILFVSTRESSLRLTRLIAATGKTVVSYHAGMSAEERRIAEAQIAKKLPGVIVATSAFGMGMNYPGLRWAVLWQAPSSLLSFAQTIGRVGRDPNQKARALALWDDDDFRMLEWMIQGSPRRGAQLKLMREFLGIHRCRRAGLRSYFETGRFELGSEEFRSCGLCDVCAGAAAGKRPNDPDGNASTPLP